MNENTLTHQQFIEKYKSGELTVLVNKAKAGDFVLSRFADKHYKPAHLFWTWLGIICAFASVVLLFINWAYAVVAFICGLLINNASRKSAGQFVLQNMLNSEDFWNYVLLHNGVEIKDKNNITITSLFLLEMKKKHGY